MAADGTEKEILVPGGGIAFTLCQVPVIYRRGNIDACVIHFRDGSTRKENTHVLPVTVCEELFNRTGLITRIEMIFKKLI